MDTKKLSLKGKITVLNNLALAPIIYASSLINTLNKAISKINNLIPSFCLGWHHLQYISENPYTTNRQGRPKVMSF